MGNSLRKRPRILIQKFTEKDRKVIFHEMMFFFRNPRSDFFQRVVTLLSQCNESDPDYEKIVTWCLAVLQKHPEFRSINAILFPMTMESLLRVFDSNTSTYALKKTMVNIEIPQKIRRAIEIDLLWMAFGATGSPKYIELITRVIEDSSQDVSIRQTAEWSIKKYQKDYPDIIHYITSPRRSSPININTNTVQTQNPSFAASI